MSPSGTVPEQNIKFDFLQLVQAETDDLYKKINEYETAAKEANGISDKYDAEIRDMGKKVAKLEVKYFFNSLYIQI